MSKAAVRELSALLRAAVTRGGGNWSAVTTDEFAAQLSTRVWLFVGATPELIERGRAVRQRDQQQVKWARGLTRGIYQHAQTADRVARGLVDLLDHEIRTYQEEREVSEIDLPRVCYSKADLPALANQIERTMQTRLTIKREVSNPAWVELVRAFVTYQCLYEAVLTGEAIVAMDTETCRLVVFPHKTCGGSG